MTKATLMNCSENTFPDDECYGAINYDYDNSIFQIVLPDGQSLRIEGEERIEGFFDMMLQIKQTIRREVGSA